ncbi:hypothetical protein [Methylomonas sp. 11b]|uniref:hypothetical protein n=1 Tax=Methylomonas sp. 11b TaxID=1168169 RepID=UPI00047B1519|nr:hypothetical protein [Methylomonas sp. 11b]
MKLFGFPIEIDWRQKATIRGAIMSLFAAVALISYLVTLNAAVPGVVMSIGSGLSGALGLLVKD